MTTSTWLTLAGLVITVCGFIFTWLLRRADRKQAMVERLETENRLLRDTNVDLKIQVSQLQNVATVVNRTFSGLSSATSEESRQSGVD